MFVPGELAILQAIQVLLKFRKVLVNQPHVPAQQQGHDENALNSCPRHHRGKSGPVGITKHLAMASGTQMGLPLQDFSCRIPFGSLRDMGLVDNLPMFHLVCWLNSHAMASMNLSQSGCCIVTLSGIALGYPLGWAMVDANAQRLANGWKSKMDLMPDWAMFLL